MKKLLALLIVQIVVSGGLNSSTQAVGNPRNNQRETPQLKLVVKKSFFLPSYTTVGGKTIKNVKTGWESYGVLNAKRDNVKKLLQAWIETLSGKKDEMIMVLKS